MPAEDGARPAENRAGTAGRYRLVRGVRSGQSGLRRVGQRGAEILEFTFTVIPLLALVTVLVDVGWGIFAKATLQWAAHQGLRYGITVTGTQAAKANSDLTTMVKSFVQSESLGLLSSSSAAACIHVNFYGLDSTGALVNVDSSGTGNYSPNLMQVSVDKYQLPALIPRIYNFAVADTAPTTISVAAADEVEPSNDPPPMGPAP